MTEDGPVTPVVSSSRVDATLTDVSDVSNRSETAIVVSLESGTSVIDPSVDEDTNGQSRLVARTLTGSLWSC